MSKQNEYNNRTALKHNWLDSLKKIINLLETGQFFLVVCHIGRSEGRLD